MQSSDQLSLRINDVNPCHFTVNQAERVMQLIRYPATLPSLRLFKTPFLKLSGECGVFEHQLPVLLAWCLQLMLHSTGKSADWFYCVQGSALMFSQGINDAASLFILVLSLLSVTQLRNSGNGFESSLSPCTEATKTYSICLYKSS